MDKENLIYIVGSAITVLSFANEKVRNFFLGKITFKKETTDATDAVIDRLMDRVNTLSDEFLKLNESNIQTQKENFKIQQEYLKFKKEVSNKCKNNCFE